MKTIHHLLNAAARRLAAAFCACIALASCGSDDNNPAPDPPGPDPKQPLIITAEVHAATTPAALRAQWTDGDWVAVEVDDVAKRYIATPSAENAAIATLRPADADNTHYCPATECKVRAWRYGHTDTKTYIENFDWNHQPEKWWILHVYSGEDMLATNYRKSDFLYAPEKTMSSSSAAASGGNIGLTFYHQTARVVVNIREGGRVTAENKGAIQITLRNGADNDLSVLGTFDAGRINPAGGQYSGLEADRTGRTDVIYAKPILPANEGYACSYEALVIPQDISGQAFISALVSDNTAGTALNFTYTPAAGKANLQGGYTYIYDMALPENSSNPQVTIYPPAAGWIDRSEESGSMAYDEEIDLGKEKNINDNRTYLLTGTNQYVYRLVHITGGSPTIILKNADIKGRAPIKISGSSTPTIRVEGKNQIISIDGPAIKLGGTKLVRIIGDGRDKSQLTAKVLNNPDFYPAIGNRVFCSDLSLSGITLVAESSGEEVYFPAAIGIGGILGFNPNERVEQRKCGSITITDCHVEAKAYGGAAAIGFGYYEGNDANSIHEMGKIEIENSTIKSTVEKGSNGLWPAHIGGSANGVGKYTVGDIEITPPKGMNGTKFFEHFIRSGNDEDAVVGYLNEDNAGGLLNSVVICWFLKDGLPWTTRTYIPWLSVPGLP